MKQYRYDFTEEQAREFYELYLGGLSCTQIAKQQGCTINTISSTLKKYGYCIENRQNKINIDLEELIARYNSGESLAQIAKSCNNTCAALSRVLKRANIAVINRQNLCRFNEHVFDKIDTEEKAY